MSHTEAAAAASASAEAEEDSPSGEAYTAPAMKTVAELKDLDTDDPALQKMKAALLPEASPVEPNNPKNVLVRTLTLIVEGREDVVLDLSKPEHLQLVLKEGSPYRLRLSFHVQREIVSGLKYVQRLSRAGLPVDKQTLMVGSYAPQNDLHHFTTPVEEAPSGMFGRGNYSVKSLFTDDDKNEWLAWEWKAEVKKTWD